MQFFFIAGLLCASSASINGSVSHPAGDRPSHPICPFRAFGPRNLMKMDRFLKPAKRRRSYFRLWNPSCRWVTLIFFFALRYGSV
jgi:hypothetical protein